MSALSWEEVQPDNWQYSNHSFYKPHKIEIFPSGTLYSGTVHSGTLLSLSSYVDIERSSAKYNSAESLTNKYKLFGTKSKQTVNFSNIPKKPFPLTPSKKYIMIEEFKDEIKGLKYIFNEIKNRIIKRTRNK